MFRAVGVLARSLSFLVTGAWNSVSGSLLASVPFTSFPGDFSRCSTWGLFLCLPTLVASAFVSVCESGLLCPGRVAFGSRCPVGSEMQSPWSPELCGPEVPLIGLCEPLCGCGALAAVGLTVGGAAPHWL